MSEVAKFKIGDRVLFTDGRYPRREGKVVSVVTEKRERFKEVEVNQFYKICYGWIFNRSAWVDEADVKGLLS